MRSRKFRLCIALASLFFVGGITTSIRQASAQTPATQPVIDDIEIGTPAAKGVPLLLTPTPEGGVINDAHHGEAMIVQEFVFNPVTHEVGLAKNSPVKQRTYGNTRIDASYYNSDLSIFDYLTTNRELIGKIILTCAKKRIVISPNYIVSRPADKPAAVDSSTFCAFVQFEKGDECKKPGTIVMVHRNDDKPTPLADALISKIHRRTDIMTWTIERDGAVIKTGSFGFPVVATEPDLVKYVIRLP